MWQQTAKRPWALPDSVSAALCLGSNLVSLLHYMATAHFRESSPLMQQLSTDSKRYPYKHGICPSPRCRTTGRSPLPFQIWSAPQLSTSNVWRPHDSYTSPP